MYPHTTNYKVFCNLLCILLSITVAAQTTHHAKLWYPTPAHALVKDNSSGWHDDTEWLKAMPLGNGFMGAMVFGDVHTERIQLNEKSLWSGRPDDNDNPEAAKHLSAIRELLFTGQFKKATELTNTTQICKGSGSGRGNGAKVPFGSYQTMGDLWIDFNTKAPYLNYYRELDLMTGVSLTRYTQDNIDFTREIFISYPDRAMVIRLSASKAKSLSFTLSINRPERYHTVVANNRLIMSGATDNGNQGDGMKYKVNVVPLLTGGSLKQAGDKLQITNASEVTIIVTAATNHRLVYPSYIDEEFEKKLDMITKSAVSQSHNRLKEKHIQDFSSYMNRSWLQLGNNSLPALPTDSLLQKNRQTQNEQDLYALYYQYGRYVLLSSSRKGSLPANLQGIWANKMQAPWNGDYHTDVNVQMNYWPAEVANLSDSHLPLADLINSLVTPGSKTARVQYNMNGWCVHPITNVWGYTSPGESASWGMHTGGTAWISQHIWEHYAFTLDTIFLRKNWPVLKEACRFYLDWLVADPATGKLVSGPAVSPENTFITSDGTRAQISMGPAHDQQVLYNLFSNSLQAAKILRIDKDDFGKQLLQAFLKLARTKIGTDGRIMEWSEEFKEAEPTHRHISHLFALYPGNEIHIHSTPEMAAAAKKSLEARGDIATGWSLAWKMAFWARLHDGNRSLQLLNHLLNPVQNSNGDKNKNKKNRAGSFDNLFCAHPPFQMDGNFGATAAIAEMLLQSHAGSIELLPALPDSWKKGKVKGLCARGAFEIDMQWEEGRLISGVLLSKKGGQCNLKYAGQTISLQTKPGQRHDLKKLLFANKQ